MSIVYIEQAAVRLLHRPTDPLGRQPLAVSVGLRASDGRIYEGACLLPEALWPLGSRADIPRRLEDSITAAVGHQPADAFRPLAACLDASTDPLLNAPEVRLGVEQALLTAVSAAQGTSRFRQLEVEFGPLERDMPGLGLYVEVPDYAATAEVFDQVILQRPDGIGYRLTADELTDIVGPDATDLQRFVRELSARVPALTSEEYRPAVYLALNGALGQLTPDPRLHYGRILGPLAGLAATAAPLPLIVEDALYLDDSIMRAAAMSQLQEAVGFRRLSVRLAAHRGLSTLDEVDLCLQAKAASLLALEAAAWGSTAQLVEAGRRIRAAGRALVLLADAAQPYRHLAFLSELALYLGAAALAIRVSMNNVQVVSDLLDHIALLDAN